jgi:hypothetical protein
MKFLITLSILITSYISSKLHRNKVGTPIKVNTRIEITSNKKKKKDSEDIKTLGQDVYVEYNTDLDDNFISINIKKSTMDRNTVEFIKSELALPREDSGNDNILLQIPLNKVSFGFTPSGIVNYESKRSAETGPLTGVAELGFNEIDLETDYFSIVLLNINKDKNIVLLKIRLHEEEYNTHRTEFLKWGRTYTLYNTIKRVNNYLNVNREIKKYEQEVRDTTLKDERRLTLRNIMRTDLGGGSFCLDKFSLETYYSLRKKLKTKASYYIDIAKTLIDSYDRLYQKFIFCSRAYLRDVIVVMEDDGDKKRN